MTLMVNIKSRENILVSIFLLLTLPFFFYKLGVSSLTSFDEAWYGSIARNISLTGDFINLVYNDRFYIDHPPVGFLLMSIFIKFFGDSEFWVRFLSASLGWLSLIVTYFLGKELFNRWVGLSSAMALSSAFWFLFRARSGNLDIPLTFFFLLSIFLALKASRQSKWLTAFTISLSFLFLTKTIVPFTIIPTLLIIFWKSKLKLRQVIFPILFFIFMVGGWFIYQIVKDVNFLGNYFRIGLPGIKAETNYLDNFFLIKEYLHSGIGKWFWPGILGIILSVILRKRKFFILLAFLLTFFLPFIFSEKGHIWHLIPLYPFMILIFFGTSFEVVEKFTSRKFATIIIICLSLLISTIQLKQSWVQFIDLPSFTSDEAILSSEAAKYPYPLYIDGDFIPVAVFYSRKNKIEQIFRDDTLPTLIKNKKIVLIITNNWRLDELKLDKKSYSVVRSDRDKVLIINTNLLLL